MSALPLFGPGEVVARPLRPHQERGIVLLKQSLLAGASRVVLQMPTGAGKTRTAAEVIKGARAKGNRVAFVVPAISLIDQTVEAFRDEGITEIGVMQANHELTDLYAPVQVCSVQTLAKRGCPDFEVVIVDECHLQFQVIKDWMEKRPDTKFVGLSATPWARGMSEHWQDLVRPVSMQELIDAGVLSPFRVYAPSHPDLSGVKTVSGDYHEGQLAEAMDAGTLTADIVQTWLKLANWEPTLVFAVDRAHAAKLQREFAAAGVPMGYCDAHVDRIERRLLFDKLARREIAGICNVGTLTTGVDADIRCIVLARPTKSEMLHVQIIGRALRTAPGKTDALILDHADNHARLGFVTDIDHPTLLDGKASRHATRKEKGDPMPKECSSCGALKLPKIRECPHCGFAPEPQSEIETEEGELVELRPGKKKTAATMADKQQFWSMALAIAAERGRSRGWASHTYRDKFKVWPQRLEDRPIVPDPAFRSYIRSRDIAFAKSRGGR